MRNLVKKSYTLGQDLIDSVKEALNDTGNGRRVRPKVDVPALRKELGMTQKQFSESYHIKLDTLRNWEQAKRVPDATTLAYLTCIAKQPKIIFRILNQH
jgi:putative transcriptional regulator